MLRGLYIFAKRVFFALTIPALVWGTFAAVMYYGDVLLNGYDEAKSMGALVSIICGFIYLPSPFIYARVCAEHGVMGWDESIF